MVTRTINAGKNWKTGQRQGRNGSEQRGATGDFPDGLREGCNQSGGYKPARKPEGQSQYTTQHRNRTKTKVNEDLTGAKDHIQEPDTEKPTQASGEANSSDDNGGLSRQVNLDYGQKQRGNEERSTSGTHAVRETCMPPIQGNAAGKRRLESLNEIRESLQGHLRNIQSAS